MKKKMVSVLLCFNNRNAILFTIGISSVIHVNK